MTKSTASSSRYCRIGTQPPDRKTSGARPPAARGLSNGSDTAIFAARLFGAAVACFRRLPRIALIEIHADIAARTCRSTPADLAPGGRVGVVGKHKIASEARFEKHFRGHATPVFCRELALLHARQQQILIGLAQVAKARAESVLRLAVECLEPAPPRFLLVRHSGLPIAVLFPLMQFFVDQGGYGNRRPR